MKDRKRTSAVKVHDEIERVWRDEQNGRADSVKTCVKLKAWKRIPETGSGMERSGIAISCCGKTDVCVAFSSPFSKYYCGVLEALW